MKKKISKEELEAVLEAHKAWLYDDLKCGKRADLEDADLTGAKLKGAHLRSAIIINAILTDADLRHANLSNANLSGAVLVTADLRGADLRHVDLTGADLRHADLRDANLSDANLIGANLTNAKLECPVVCPEVGSFIAFKQVYINGECFVAKLRIPSQAKRCSATTRKCRASEAKVMGFFKLDGRKSNIEEARSLHDSDFIYKKGKIVTPEKPFCEDRWNECASGIHFFMSFEEAAEY